MAPTTARSSFLSVRGITTTLVLPLLLLASCGQTSILPRQQDKKILPWVTVDANGAFKTITPTVQGGKTTSAFPGNPAVPTADANGAGAFLVCSEETGSHGTYQPFCAPENGAEVEVGKTYFITWDTGFFQRPETQVMLQGNYLSADPDPGIADTGFSSEQFGASKGFFAWSPGVGDVDLPEVDSTEVRFYLAYLETNGTIRDKDPGPKVLLHINKKQKSRGKNATAIAVGVVVGIVGLGVIVGLAWFFLKKKVKLGGSRNSGGYGVRRSKIQRSAGIALDASPSFQREDVDFSRAAGRNVFREEVARQDKGTGY